MGAHNDRLSAIILSGGLATRMGGIDKGLVTLNNKPLIQYVIERLSPQVDELMINANREILRYQSFRYQVLRDDNPDWIGPLAGFSLGLQHSKYDYVLTTPCDSPLIPADLASRLMAALFDNHAEIAVAKSAGHAHPVFCLMKKSVSPSLSHYLARGERKVSAWQKSLDYIEVSFDDCQACFVNLNTIEALEALTLELNNE